MSTKPAIWILLIVLYVDAVECQWGLSFGWFWGKVEDLKSSKVESGVVKSSAYFPGSKTKNVLFDDSDSSSSEEDSVAIFSSTFDRQGRDRSNYRLRSRNSIGVRRRKKLRKHGKRSKSSRKGQYQNGIQKLRRRYKDHIRRKYGRKARKGTKHKHSKSRDQDIASITPRKDRTSILEELLNPRQDSQTLGTAPNAKQVSQANAQGIKPSATVKKAGHILNNHTKVETTTNPIYEQEVETENEITDAPETERQFTLPTTTTTELTTPEPEYESEYYGVMDLFGDALDIFRPRPDLNVGENMHYNETGQSEEENVQNKGTGRDLNTQASPLKSNDVAMQNLGKPPQSKPGSSNFETNSTERKLINKDGVTTKGNTTSDSSPVYIKETNKPVVPTLQSQQFKSINVNPKITSKGHSLPQQMVSAEPVVTAPQYQKFISSKIINNNPKGTSGRLLNPRHSRLQETLSIPINPADQKFESSKAIGINQKNTSGRPSKPQQTVSLPTKPYDQKFESSKIIDVNPKFASGRPSKTQQTVSIPAEAERRYLEKHKNQPTALQLGVKEKSFTLHADHPQAWKSYDIIDPKQNIIYDDNSIMKTPKEPASARIKGKTTQGQTATPYKASMYKETSKNNSLANRGMVQANKLSQDNPISNGVRHSINKQSGVKMGKPWHSNMIIPNNDKNRSSLRPGDSIINGKNGKKINALFANADRKTEEGQKTSHNELMYQTTPKISSARDKDMSHGNEYSQKYPVNNGGLFSAIKVPDTNFNKNEKLWNSDRTISNVQNKLILKPSDSMNNVKKINTLYPKDVRKTTAKMPTFSSKIEKTWVDAFLPEKFTAPKRTNLERTKTTSSSSLNGTIRSRKVVPKTLSSLFSLPKTTREGQNVLLSRLGKKVNFSKTFIPAPLDSSLSRYSKAANNVSKSPDVNSKGAVVNVSNQNLDITVKNRPIATLSHMPSSVTAIPSDRTRSSWDNSVNDRMSYKYKKPELKLEKNLVSRKHDNIGVPHRSLTISDKNSELTKSGILATWSTRKKTDQPQLQDKFHVKISGESKKTRQFQPVVNSDFNMGVKGRLQPQRASNLISEGFPSRINKEISTKTDTKVDMYPDIPSQGDVHIKLPEIPTRLTKELGQGDRTNSHQKSAPEPPVVVEQIQVPTNSVFSYPSSNNTERTLSSTSIDGRLVNIQQPPATAKKLQLTLLETEQKPNSRIAAPFASGLNQSKKAKSKMIHAQNIQLIPYSNAIPMKIFQGESKHSGNAPPHELSPFKHDGGKRHDKPIKDHRTSKMQSNLLEKQSEAHIKSNVGHKEYKSENFRLTSAEIMTTPSKKERKNITLPSRSHSPGNLPRIRNVNDSRSLLHRTKTGGGRNIISEMKSQLRQNVTSIHNEVSPNTLEYQGTPVKVEKIPNVSLLSKQNRSKVSTTSRKVHNVAFSGKHLKQTQLKSNIYSNGGSGETKPLGLYSASNTGMLKTNVRVPGQGKFALGEPHINTSNKMDVKKFNSSGRYNLKNPQPIVTASSNPTTRNGEFEAEQEGQLQTTQSRIHLGFKTTPSPSTRNSEYEVEQEGELQTTKRSTSSSRPTTSAGEIENEAEEEQRPSSQPTQRPTQQSTTPQEESEFENDYPTTMGGQTGGSGRGPQMVGAAGDDIFSGSWKETVRENAREIALEMEGTWTAVNGSTIGGKNTCPSYKMRYQGNAVVFDTIVDQCRVIITWNKRQQREQVQEKVWWGVNAYYRSRTIFVPVVTYVDLR